MAHLTVEVVYRGIFQKNLAARITRGIVLSSRKAGRWGIAFGRYGDSPQRNGIPAKDFAIVADTKEELEQHMARYEPKELHVTICVDDTLCKGVESWAWYGLQPINRLLLSGGHLLVTSTRSPSELLRDIHKKDAPYHLWILPGKASFSGLWVFKEDHTEARVLGALAKIASEFLDIDAVCAAIREAEWGSELKAESARKAYERVEGRRIQMTEGNDEVPFSFEMPKWWEMREGVTIPAIPVGKPVEGGKGYRPERNPYFKKFTTRTMRPVVNFDTCVKCTLCWIQCPDSVLRRDAGRALRRQHGGVLRVRGVRGGLPREGLHHDGERGRVRRQPEPVGDVAPGQGRVPRLGRARRSRTRSPPCAPTASATAASTRRSSPRVPLELGGTPGDRRDPR